VSAQLKVELENLVKRDGAHLFHDDLAEINDPVYFHELNEHAERHGLQFLGEADLAASGYGSLTLTARRVLESLDLLTREQYLDFILCRRFRQTLLCHADVALDRSSAPGRIATLFLAARGRVAVTPREPDDASVASDDGTARDAAVLLKAVLAALEQAAPRRLTFDELAAIVDSGEGGGRLRERGREFFQQVVFGAARAGALLVHAGAPKLTTEPSERPVASPIARQQIATGSMVTTLCHEPVNVDQETARRLLPLLDGTRTRSALVAALGTALEGNNAKARVAKLDEHLRYFAKLALLSA